VYLLYNLICINNNNNKGTNNNNNNNKGTSNNFGILQNLILFFKISSVK